jgi:hypothetical protein
MLIALSKDPIQIFYQTIQLHQKTKKIFQNFEIKSNFFKRKPELNIYDTLYYVNYHKTFYFNYN